MKFKVGDRVKVIGGDHPKLVGLFGTIEEVDEEWHYPYYVKYDDDNYNDDFTQNLFDDGELELLETKAIPYRNEKIENNFTYHAPKEGQSEKYEMIRDKAKELAYIIDTLCPYSREKEEAFKRLEESVFWTNAGIARN